VVFLVDQLVLYQARGLAVFQAGRDICSQNKSLCIYTTEDRNDSLSLCSASSVTVSRGQEVLPPIKQHTQKFRWKLSCSLSRRVCGYLLFFCLCS